MTDQHNVYSPLPVTYTAAGGPPLTIPAASVQALVSLAGHRSEPGAAVSVSDLVNVAIDNYLAGTSQQRDLADAAEAVEQAEAQRIEAEHGAAA